MVEKVEVLQSNERRETGENGESAEHHELRAKDLMCGDRETAAAPKTAQRERAGKRTPFLTENTRPRALSNLSI
jgi:hypothetical protein